jgi:hypothetical protein
MASGSGKRIDSATIVPCGTSRSGIKLYGILEGAEFRNGAVDFDGFVVKLTDTKCEVLTRKHQKCHNQTAAVYCFDPTNPHATTCPSHHEVAMKEISRNYSFHMSRAFNEALSKDLRATFDQREHMLTLQHINWMLNLGLSRDKLLRRYSNARMILRANVGKKLIAPVIERSKKVRAATLDNFDEPDETDSESEDEESEDDASEDSDHADSGCEDDDSDYVDEESEDDASEDDERDDDEGSDESAPSPASPASPSKTGEHQMVRLRHSEPDSLTLVRMAYEEEPEPSPIPWEASDFMRSDLCASCSGCDSEEIEAGSAHIGTARHADASCPAVPKELESAGHRCDEDDSPDDTPRHIPRPEEEDSAHEVCIGHTSAAFQIPIPKKCETDHHHHHHHLPSGRSSDATSSGSCAITKRMREDTDLFSFGSPSSMTNGAPSAASAPALIPTEEADLDQPQRKYAHMSASGRPRVSPFHIVLDDDE